MLNSPLLILDELTGGCSQGMWDSLRTVQPSSNRLLLRLIRLFGLSCSDSPSTCPVLPTVPVPEEHPDVPGGVQRRLRHEEERAVRVLRPFRRQGLWKGKTSSPGDAAAASAIAGCVYAESAKSALMCFDVL